MAAGCAFGLHQASLYAMNAKKAATSVAVGQLPQATDNSTSL